LPDRAVADVSMAAKIDCEAALAWHREQLVLPEHDRGDVLAAILHLGPVIDAEKDKLEQARLLFRRGLLSGRGGGWQQAAADFARGLELDPRDHWHWYQSAVLRLQVGDRPGYLRHCREMLERFGKTNDRSTAERVAKTCCLVREGPGNDPLLMKLAG